MKPPLLYRLHKSEFRRSRGQFPSALFPIPPWSARALYKKRNEIERLFRRLKGFRRIFSRFEKLDILFIGFLNFAFIVEALR